MCQQIKRIIKSTVKFNKKKEREDNKSSTIQHPPLPGATNKKRDREPRAAKAYMERERVCLC